MFPCTRGKMRQEGSCREGKKDVHEKGTPVSVGAGTGAGTARERPRARLPYRSQFYDPGLLLRPGSSLTRRCAPARGQGPKLQAERKHVSAWLKPSFVRCAPCRRMGRRAAVQGGIYENFSGRATGILARPSLVGAGRKTHMKREPRFLLAQEPGFPFPCPVCSGLAGGFLQTLSRKGGNPSPPATGGETKRPAFWRRAVMGWAGFTC